MHGVPKVASCEFLNVVELADDRSVIKVVVKTFSVQISM